MKRTQFGRWAILLLIWMPYIVPLHSQVTIGADQKALDFETLRIDGNKQGLRLTRLNKTQRESLETVLMNANSNASDGLMIYNTESGRIEFWDQANRTWRTLSTEAYSFDNGLTFNTTTQKGELGGMLNSDTEIDQNGKTLNIGTTGTGAFTINDTDLAVTNTSITSIGLTNFSITPPSSNINFTVTGQNNVDVTVDDKKLDVNNATLVVTEDTITVTGSLHYIDGNQAVGGTNGTRILTSDVNGLGRWTQLTAVVESKDLGIKWPAPGNNGDFITSTWTDVTDEFTLEKGRWLVMGRMGTYTHSSTPTTASNYLNMLRLRQTAPSAATKYVSGALPERKSTTGNTDTETTSGAGAYCTPMMIAYIEVAASSEKFKVQFNTSKDRTRRARTNWMGTSYFRAIKIAD